MKRLLPRHPGRILLWSLGGLLVLALVGAGLLALSRPWLTEKVRSEVERRIESRYGGDVELGAFDFSLYPFPGIVVDRLRIRREGDPPDVPLISVRRLTADFGFFGLLRDPVRVHHVRLEGLEIQISHRHEKDSESGRGGTRAENRSRIEYPFILEKVDADGTELRIFPKDPTGDPLEWDMKQLSLHSVGLGRPLVFDTQMTNAKPPGLIRSHGEFGPWNREDPGDTPVSGRYDFSDADLSVFGGIAGHLSSTGRYQGVLSRIEVDGTTDTPDFSVDVGGHPVQLSTRFHAIVDGTDGDTELDPVEAHFLGADINARGSIAKQKGEKAKSIRLRVEVQDTPVQDLLFLVLHETPAPVTGAVTVDTLFVLPTGPEDVLDRLQLEGSFSIKSAEFTNRDTQQKLEDLSWRARGRPDAEKGDPERVASDMTSRFALKRGVASFSGLSFKVPGASVQLDGSNNLESGALDFRGKLRMDATLSQATGGIKSFFLKLVDPFFKKDGAGAVVPIKIGGSIDDPSFGLAF